MQPNLFQLVYLAALSASAIPSLTGSGIADDDQQLPYQLCAQTKYNCYGVDFFIAYPFSMPDQPTYCGYPGFDLVCDRDHSALIINITGKQFQVNSIDYFSRVLNLTDPLVVGQACPPTLRNATLDFSLWDYIHMDLNLTVYLNCSEPVIAPGGIHVIQSCSSNSWAGGNHSYFRLPSETGVVAGSESCGLIAVVPILETILPLLLRGIQSFSDLLEKGFGLTWMVGEGWCDDCMVSGGLCGFNDGNTCFCPNTTSPGLTCRLAAGMDQNDSEGKRIAIGVGAGTGGLLVLCCLAFFIYLGKKRKQRSSAAALLYRSASSETSTMKDPELGSGHYQTQVFTYNQLQDATNNFDPSRELGDGGFGTVYKGKLQDGRTVAVKRLYENNYRRLEQFMNEIEILSRIRHQNLVTLYGCTSRQTRELILVYEFVPNGTVADHLHGHHVQEGALTWPVRMNIAIETADALAYLHAIEPQIIHRDIKTTNILLDKNFHVKVADFGLSRLFPVDATHVSTAPQGTPGYVDPEYYQCYQLTDKSDVYSFGVVLVELISSKPAVDISRQRNEINLASLAISKIQKSELDQLVDPALGYQTDDEVKRSTTMVAELAFRCLQAERDLRPSVKEVLEVLRAIESGGRREETAAEASAKDDDQVLRSVTPTSPNSVTEKWASRETTPNTSN